MRLPSSPMRRPTLSASGLGRSSVSAACVMSPSMCPTRRTIVSTARLRTATGPSAGMDRTATPCVALTCAITGRRAVCRGRSVTQTTSCQPRSRSIRRPAEISSLRTVGGSTSRSETNSTLHRAPGSCTASRSAISGSRLSVSSEAGPGDASRPTTSSGCCVRSGKLAAEVSTVPSSRAIVGEDDDHDAPLPGRAAHHQAAVSRRRGLRPAMYPNGDAGAARLATRREGDYDVGLHPTRAGAASSAPHPPSRSPAPSPLLPSAASPPLSPSPPPPPLPARDHPRRNSSGPSWSVTWPPPPPPAAAAVPLLAAAEQAAGNAARRRASGRRRDPADSRPPDPD